MKIIVSSYSGFCFGVRRALDIAQKALGKQKEIYSLGPIIHNPHVVNEFSKKGLTVVRDIKDIKRGAAVLIPSHGINPALVKRKNLRYIDTTCPLVSKVQGIVNSLRKKGYFIIIVGDKEHPEVKALVGIAEGNCCVLRSRQEAKNLVLRSKKAALIVQTTASPSVFKDILSEMAKKDFTELASFNTVCKNTRDRQKEAQRIAGGVDAMLIVGGKNSANTSRLAQVCRKVNQNSYHIESVKDLKPMRFRNAKSIGVATGASTPLGVLREITDWLRDLEKPRGKK